MRLRGLDLNTLVALNVLFQEKSVTAAARRLHVGQSAMSGTLAGLRAHFGDRLLETAGRRLILTPFGQSLVEPLAETIRHIEMVAGASGSFDPYTAHRKFTIIASDYAIDLVVPLALPTILRDAPGVRLTFSHPDDAPGIRLNQGDVDLVITPDGFLPPAHIAESFYEDDHVVIGCNDNPIMKAPLELEAFARAPQIVVRFGRNQQETFAERELSRIGRKITPTVVAASFTSVPSLIVGTELISVVHRRLAERLAHKHSIAIQEVPFLLPKMRQMMLFHPLRQADSGLLWLRNLLKRFVY